MATDPVDLITACINGDSAACAALFERYKGLIYRTAYLIGGNAQDAEDALQEVFLRALRSLHTYSPERGAFTTWLYRITVNYCLGQRRSARRQTMLPLDGEAADPDGDPSAISSLTDEAALLLDALSDEQRVVAVLRFYGNLSYREIADILGVELGTVQSRLSRALKKMRAVADVAQEVG